MDDDIAAARALLARALPEHFDTEEHEVDLYCRLLVLRISNRALSRNRRTALHHRMNRKLLEAMDKDEDTDDIDSTYLPQTLQRSPARKRRPARQTQDISEEDELVFSSPAVLTQAIARVELSEVDTATENDALILPAADQVMQQELGESDYAKQQSLAADAMTRFLPALRHDEMREERLHWGREFYGNAYRLSGLSMEGDALDTITMVARKYQNCTMHTDNGGRALVQAVISFVYMGYYLETEVYRGEKVRQQYRAEALAYLTQHVKDFKQNDKWPDTQWYVVQILIHKWKIDEREVYKQLKKAKFLYKMFMELGWGGVLFLNEGFMKRMIGKNLSDKQFAACLLFLHELRPEWSTFSRDLSAALEMESHADICTLLDLEIEHAAGEQNLPAGAYAQRHLALVGMLRSQPVDGYRREWMRKLAVNDTVALPGQNEGTASSDEASEPTEARELLADRVWTAMNPTRKQHPRPAKYDTQHAGHKRGRESEEDEEGPAAKKAAGKTRSVRKRLPA